MTTISPTKTPDVPKPQRVFETDEQEAPSIAQPGATPPAGGQEPTQPLRNNQGLAVVPNQGLDAIPGAKLKPVTLSNTSVKPGTFQRLEGRVLLIVAFLTALRTSILNQKLLNETHSAAQKQGSEIKTSQTKMALVEEAKIIKEAKEKKATCDIVVDVLMILVAVVGAVLSAGVLAPALLVLAAAVIVAKLAIDIRKKQLVDEGDYDGADSLNDAARGLEITAMVLSSVAGGVTFAKSVATIAMKTAARVAARGVTEATKVASTATLKTAAEAGKTITKNVVSKVTKRSAQAAVKEAATDNASKASVREAAEAGAKAGLKEAMKKSTDTSAVIGKEAIKKSVGEVASELVKKAVKNYRRVIIQAVKEQMKRITGSMTAGVSSFNALSLFVYKTEMADADRISDQLEVLLMLINKIITALGKLKEGGNKEAKSLVDAAINSIRSLSGNFKQAVGTLSSLATAMSPGGK